jgi:L-2-hydroxyglutarate oxidase LhgO
LDADVVIVGAGVVGLATAAALSRAGRSVLIVERNDAIALETTSRNSEVIHAGIYYPADSLKATLCCDGRAALYERCEAHRIGYRRTGKLIVATARAEIEKLEQLLVTATRNGAPGLALVDAAEVSRLEPQVAAVAALLSPETGIVDGHGLCLSYLAEAEAHGADLVLRSKVVALACRSGSGGSSGTGGWRVEIEDDDGARHAIDCGAVVNAAGLASDRVAALAGMDIAACDYTLRLCKGDYFSLAPGAGISLEHLIYPLPVDAGLGVHATLDLGGRIRFGPDTEYIDEIRYDVDPAKASEFAAAITRYLPTVSADALAPDYAGVRPKLAGPGEGFKDFVVGEESDAGFPALVNCIGIESPGLTASSAIGDRVVALLRGL